MIRGNWPAGLARAVCLGAFVCFASAPAFASAADDESGADKSAVCLPSPKATAPKGERWYYRVDRVTKRHCWYTRAGAEQKIAAQKSAFQPPKPVVAPEPAPEPLLSSVANARAEADLSAAPPPPAESAPQDIPAANPTPSPSGPLVDRWPGHDSADSPQQLLPAVVTPSSPPAPAPQERTSLTQQGAPADSDDDPLWALLIIVGFGSVLIGLATPTLVTFIGERKSNCSSRQERSHANPNVEGVDAMWRDAPVQWQRPNRQPSDQRRAAATPAEFRPARRTT